MNYEPSTQAALTLAVELGGRLLIEQVNRSVNQTIDGLNVLFSDDQLTDIRRQMVTSLMANLFNPAYAEGEHINGLTLNRDVIQVGYNQTEPLCYLPIQKIINLHKGN